MADINIAIDGPAASGKGTVARGVAKALDLQYVDTGAMFRTVALLAGRQNISWSDADALERLTASLIFHFRWNGDELSILANGEDVSVALREESVGTGASVVSRYQGVRTALLLRQQSLAKKGGVVMDGRDIGTVVLPDADIKVFLVADLEVRAQRRHIELKGRGESVSFSEVREQISSRDKQDIQRDVAPLRQAADALLVDSTRQTPEQLIEFIKSLALSMRTP